MDETKPHILIIEDDEDTRFVYSVLLQMEGYYVTQVGTVAEGLPRALSTTYDLLIMDVRLPDGDGVELCKHIRTFNKVTPIIFVSAAAFKKDVERGMQAGAQAYITKPADADNLIEKVHYLLGQKSVALAAHDGSALTVLVAGASVAVALIDKDWFYKAVSQPYAAAGGYTAADLIGRRVTDIFPDVSGQVGQMLEIVRQTGEPHFISRYPFSFPHHPERGITYWDAAIWPIDGQQSDRELLIVIREKDQSGDIAVLSTQ